jgi:transposase-like protein
VWRYVYRAVDRHGQVIDVLVATRRDAVAARKFLAAGLSTLKVISSGVVTDTAAVCPGRSRGIGRLGVASRRAAREQPDRG